MAWHKVKGNAGESSPRHVCTLSVSGTTETLTGGNCVTRERFASGHAIFYRRGKSGDIAVSPLAFDSANDFWLALFEFAKPRTLTWIVTNGMSRCMTLLGAWELFESKTLALTIDSKESSDGLGGKRKQKPFGYIVDSDPPVIIHCRGPAECGSLRFVDTDNWGISGDKFTGDDVEMSAGIKSWFNGWADTVKSKNLGNFAATVAGQAWNSWRHDKEYEPPVAHDDKAVIKLEGEAYYGAFNLCNRIGKINGSVHHFDFNSLYPYVAANNSFPIRLAGSGDGCDVNDLYQLALEFPAVAAVEVNSMGATYPVHHSGRLLFVEGNFWTVLCGEELLLSLEHGHVKRVGRYAWYRGGVPFAGWVRRLYRERLAARAAGDEVTESVLKKVLQHLFGKFAQRSPTWKPSKEQLAPKPFGSYWRQSATGGEAKAYRSIGWLEEERGELGFQADSMPIISAMVSGFARVKLRSILEIVGDRNWFYCDTDSVFCNQAGRANLEAFGLIHQTEIGKLKAVATYDTMEIFGLKTYKVNGELVAAGLGSCDMNDTGGYVTHRTRQRLRTILTGTPPDHIDYKEAVYTLRSNYLHGVVQATGQTRPYLLVNGELS